MRVGPLLVGAAIGGAVWVVALRAASDASRKADDATGGTKSPPFVPGTDVPIPDAVSDASAGNGELAAAAHGADGTQVVVAERELVAGVGVGGVKEFTVDAATRTIVEDTTASPGGQGADQQTNTIARGDTAPPDKSPTYRKGSCSVEDFIRARWGASGTEGMTQSQIAACVAEAQRTGGLAS